MSATIPRVIRWDTFPRDMTEPIHLFDLSRFNYFYTDQPAGVTMGYWEVEKGGEFMGDADHPRTNDEIIVVLKGRLFVSGDGEPEQTAGPGDIIMVLHGRETRLRVEERTRAFFLLWNSNPGDIIERMHGKGNLSFLPQPFHPDQY
jgi:quercetin dioxygenase-like cupin family protein